MLLNLSLPFKVIGDENFSYTDISKGMIAGTVSTSTKSIAKTVSVRLEPNLLGFIDFAVANANGKFSRNSLIVNLILAGAESVWANMSDDERKKFHDKLIKQQIEIDEFLED